MISYREIQEGNIIHTPGSDVIVDFKLILAIKENEGYGKLYSGIPLTEEWFLVFGFNKIDKKFHKLRFLIEEGISILDDEWSFRITTTNTDSTHCKSIKYVHELQNIYYELQSKQLIFTQL